MVKTLEGRFEILIEDAETASPAMGDNTFDENVELLLALLGILAELNKLVEKSIADKAALLDLPGLLRLSPE